ncbi:MAG: hypothetical protein AAGN15_20735 [Cyanobacteria bacterium J06581_3]
MTTVGKAEPINRRPGCLEMALHFNTVSHPGRTLPPPSSSTHSQSSNKPWVEVSLTIDFRGEQMMPIPAGRQLGLPEGEISLGFRRGRLQLFLGNCQMPQTGRGLGQENNQSAPIDDLVEEKIKQKVEVSTSLKCSEKKSRLNDFFEGMPFTSEDSSENIHVERSGSDESPIWTFEAQGKQKILEGKFTEVVLGQLCCLSIPCFLSARFVVCNEDIRLDWGEGPSSMQIPRNKVAVIQKVLTHDYIKIDSYPLSEVRWQHE